VPGLVLAALYMGFIVLRVKLNPTLAPKAHQPLTWSEARTAAGQVVPFVLLVFIVLGSIYGGFATPTEAGAVGVVGAMLIAAAHGKLKQALLTRALQRTALMSGSILFIVFTSMIFAYATTLSGAGEGLVEWLKSLNVSRVGFLLMVMVFFGILGCFMEGLGMIAIAVPVIYPVLLSLNIDPVWFGVFVVVLVELGQLTPPLGVILFVVASGSKVVTLEEVILGTMPFFLIIIGFMLLLIAFPQIALLLPSLTFG
jgi:C4-dicarboxylate transporter DctM subunit